MRRREFYWSLYHSTESNQIDNLRTDQIEAIYAAIPEKMRKEWFIWKEGMSDWKPFADFPQLLMSLRKTDDRVFEEPPQPPRPGEKKKESTFTKTMDAPKLSISENEGTVALSLDDGSRLEDRGNVRFKKKLEVRIVEGSISFKSVTVNISLRGMQLRDALPDNLPAYFNVEVRSGPNVVPLVGSVVPSRDGSPPNRIKIEANEYAHALFAMLLATA